MDELRCRGGRLRRGAGTLLLSLAVAAAVTGGYLGLRHDAASGDAGAGPAARTGAVMAYDPATGDVVMFGGDGASGQPLADTWLWDGSAWSPALAASHPPARYGAQMAWDPQSQRVILLGGTGGSGCASGDRGDGVGSSGAACTQLQDAWAWDGSDWSQLDLGSGARQVGYYSLEGASMATDPASGRIVLVTDGNPAAQLLPDQGVESSGGAAVGTATAVAGSSGGGSACVAAGGGPCGSPATPPSGISVPPVETACPAAGGCTSPTCDAATAACGICPVTSGVAGSASSSSQVICTNCPAVGAPCALEPATFTWVFDGSAFQPVDADPGSSPSSGGELVWFPGPGRLADISPAVYAPIDCPAGDPCPISPEAEAWTWTGSGWARADVLSSNAAAPYFGTPPVADLSAGDVVGVDSSGATWTSTAPASGWVEASPTISPPARTGFALAFDGATGEVVLAAGQLLGTSSSAGDVVGDTWTWDGSGWSRRGGAAPSPPASGPATPAPSISDLPARVTGLPLSSPSSQILASPSPCDVQCPGPVSLPPSPASPSTAPTS